MKMHLSHDQPMKLGLFRVARVAASLFLLSCGGRIAVDEPGAAACEPTASCSAGGEGAATVAAAGGEDGSAGHASLDATVSGDSGPLPPAPASDASPGDSGRQRCPPGTSDDDGACIPDDAGEALGTIAPCLKGGNVFHIEADPDAYLYAGVEDVSGPWAVSSQDYSSPNDVVVVEVTPGGVYADMTYVDFMSDALHASLETGTVYYPTISNYATTNPYGDVAEFHLQNGSTACIDRSAAFVFDAFEASDAGLARLTARFWMHCHGHSGLVRGCIHYEGSISRTARGLALPLAAWNLEPVASGGSRWRFDEP